MINVLLTLTILFLGSYMTLSKDIPAWEQRGFAPMRGLWTRTFIISGLVGYTVSILAEHLTGGNAFVALIMGILGAFSFFIAVTDFYTSLAPHEVTSLMMLLMLPMPFIGILGNAVNPGYTTVLLFTESMQTNQWVNFAFFLFVPLFFLVAAAIGGSGIADVKAFIAVTFGLSWWVGANNMVVITIFACVLGLLTGIIGKSVNWDQGKEKADYIFAKKRKKKPKAHPFLPAICVAFTAGGLIVPAIFPH